MAPPRQLPIRFPRRQHRWVFPVLAALVAVTVGPLLAPRRAAAHTELIQGSPGPGQQVGGAVDFIDLAFLDAVTDALVSVTFEGAALPGAMTVTDGQIIRFELDEPISENGSYELTYSVTAADGDRMSSSYSFLYEAGSPAPQRIGTPPEEGAGAATFIAAAFLAVVALVGGVLLTRNWLALRRHRVDD